MPAVAIVDDDLDFATMCARTLRAEGYEAQAIEGPLAAMQALSNPQWRGLVTDLRMPGMTGLDLLSKIKSQRPDLAVILMTGYGTLQTAIAAMRAGAADMLTKPFDVDDLIQTVKRHIPLEAKTSPTHAEKSGGLDTLVGQSPAMRRVRDLVKTAASAPSAVLILGESGTGKELVARAIHELSPRSAGPWLAVNCAALPQDLVESEVFGHRKGAFSGALRDALGLFRAADQGTLFLDEVFEMPAQVQAKFLRVLEDQCVRPIGSIEDYKVSVRVIAATNRPMAEMQRSRDFRHDLFYRLSVLRIDLPPLRDRLEDLPLLVNHMINDFNKRLGRQVQGIDEDALARLYAHSWPGNVRELRNAVEGAYAVSQDRPILGAEDFSIFAMSAASATGPGFSPTRAAVHTESSFGQPGTPKTSTEPRFEVLASLDDTLEQVEKDRILRTIELCGGNKSKAAEILKISRKRIYRKLEEYGMPVGKEES